MTNQEMLIKAEEVARKAHSNQFRRDNVTPYIKHVESVVSRVSSTDEKIVAWLHDVIEDTPTTAKDLLEMGFDSNIVKAVELLTKTEGYDYIEYMRAIKLNKLAKAVKIADMRSNLADSPTKKQIARYSDGILYLTT
jgi:(p)ppGpp synthase/HD superfamily hydrolase